MPSAQSQGRQGPDIFVLRVHPISFKQDPSTHEAHNNQSYKTVINILYAAADEQLGYNLAYTSKSPLCLVSMLPYACGRSHPGQRALDHFYSNVLCAPHMMHVPL